MKTPSGQDPANLQDLIRMLLEYGTWLACIIIAVGLAMSFFAAHLGASGLIMVGIGLLISLPILRLFIMFFGFLRDGDYGHSAIAAIVLLIIGASLALGMQMAKPARKYVSSIPHCSIAGCRAESLLANTKSSRKHLVGSGVSRAISPCGWDHDDA